MQAFPAQSMNCKTHRAQAITYDCQASIFGARAKEKSWCAHKSNCSATGGTWVSCLRCLTI